MAERRNFRYLSAWQKRFLRGEKREFIKFSEIISTHLLTVLTIGDITQIVKKYKWQNQMEAAVLHTNPLFGYCI